MFLCVVELWVTGRWCVPGMVCPRGDPCVHILGCVCGIVSGIVAGGDWCRAGVQCERLCVGREWRSGRGRSNLMLGALSPLARAVRNSGARGDSWDPQGLARSSGAACTSPVGRQVHAAHVGRLCALTRGGGMSAIRFLLPWWRGDGQESCSRVRNPGVSGTCTATWVRHLTTPHLSGLQIASQMGTDPPLGSVVTVKMRTHSR